MLLLSSEEDNPLNAVAYKYGWRVTGAVIVGIGLATEELLLLELDELLIGLEVEDIE
jgi:hypothetical protein